jgi:hypothetical protein
METSASADNNEPQVQPSQDGDKLVIGSVISHDKLLGMIAERNPILARHIRRRRSS